VPEKPQRTAKTLVIVESPAKAKTIGRYLGDSYEVESSIGHIRDLPSTAAEIPAELKSESWARLGVNVEKDFEPVYVIPAGKKDQVRKLKGHLKHASELLLATDGDREGEAIAWHLAEVLDPKCPVKRLVFDEITKSAITKALEHPRRIDRALVDAQETRRILDRLFGYEVSPVLWRKIKPRLSAGRVQSVATRLVVERERDRMRFVKAAYWDIEAQLETDGGHANGLDVKLVALNGDRVATGKDFNPDTGKLKASDRVVLLDEAKAKALASKLESAKFTVTEKTEKPFTNRPYAPFITSTLQQESARKLRFGAQRTMRIAQSLYEAGYITYMRTDSTTLSKQAISAARAQVNELYGAEYLPAQPRIYASRSKNAQEAHEAIRPAGESFRTPKSLETEVTADQLRLYELIWKRTVASQMKDAHGMRTSVRIEADGGAEGRAAFTASGKVIQFPGFLRAYVEGADDPEAELEDKEKILPPLSEGQQLDPKNVEAVGHETMPPARFTEASLVKALEELGIGRPSTYATIIQTIQDRGYVVHKSSALVPTFTAFAVTALLEKHLANLVDYEFTARMEGVLDSIASGERASGPWLRDFYYGASKNGRHGEHDTIIGLKPMVNEHSDEIDPREISAIPIGTTATGEPVVVRVGRYGPYIQIGDNGKRASVPDDLAPDELTVEKAERLVTEAENGDRVIGHHPTTGQPVYLKTGRFGPYVQLGDPELTDKGTIKRGTKPKMASLWPSMSVEALTLDEAVMLLSFPREVGVHPETNQVITAQDGRFGPYLRMGDDSRSLGDHDKLAGVTLTEAVEIFKQPKGRRTNSGTIKDDLGKHPETDLTLQVKSGRFGPYVTDGVVNATIPKAKDPESLTVAEAVELIAAREQRLRDQGKDPRAPKAKKSAKTKSAKKATVKKKTVKKRSTSRKRPVGAGS